MKKILLKAAAILLIIAGIAACGKENNEPPIKLAWTEWKLAGIVDVQTGTMREFESYVCSYLFFDTDSTAHTCESNNEIYIHISPQVYIVIKIEEDINSYTGDLRLFYDTVKTLRSYNVTKEELKLYCNGDKNYLLYKRIYLMKQS